MLLYVNQSFFWDIHVPIDIEKHCMFPVQWDLSSVTEDRSSQTLFAPPSISMITALPHSTVRNTENKIYRGM